MSDEEQTSEGAGADPAGQVDDPSTPDVEVTDPPPDVGGPPLPTSNRRRRLAGRSRWAVIAAAVAVLALGAAATAVFAFSEFDGRHGHSERNDESHGLGGSCDRGGRFDEKNDESDNDHTNTCPEIAQRDGRRQDPTRALPPNTTRLGDPNGPIVIEPTTPGGDRTVVWPDGRIVTIPSQPTSTGAPGAPGAPSAPGIPGAAATTTTIP